MKTLIAAVLFAAAAFSQNPQAPSPQDATPSPQDAPPVPRKGARLEMVRKLRADLDQAAARATFTEPQRQQFTAAVEALRKQGEAGRKSGAAAADRGSVREALQTLRSLADSEAFQPQDRELLKKDLQHLRKASAKGRRPRA